jgi:adenine-specific DNA-methyltransferase
MAFEINKTELVWPGKYDEEGNLVQPPRVSLPFQVIERVNETRATREAKKAEGLTLFDVWDGKNEGSTFEDGWRNKLIWGDNALILQSLKENFAGKVNLVYIDPPFATDADFSLDVYVGDQKEKKVQKSQSVLEEKAYRDSWGAGGERWIPMMFERLQLLKELLASDGALVLHIDYRLVAISRFLLEETFGPGRMRNEIIWCYRGGGVPSDAFARKHDTLLYFTNSDASPFTAQYVPYSEATQKLVEGRGGTSIDGRERDLDRGAHMPDWWVDINSLQTMSPERTGYPTQKPVALLRRIIEATTRPSDLVLDAFGGSGTTAIAAEVTGRRWIAMDLGRYAIHTTRKRLLDIPKCRPFEVLNLGKYERQFWSSANFGDDLDGDGQVNLLEYIAFILKAYGAEPFAGSARLHGKKGDAYIHVGSVSSPVTIADIETAAEECKQLKGKKLHVLGWEWEMGLHDPVVSRAKRDLGIDLALRQIPNEVMEAEAVKKGQVKFFDLAYVEVEVEPKGKSGEFVCRLKDFVTANTDLVPEEVRKQITKWSDYVDYWAIDWNFQNDTFKHDFVDYRTKQDRSLKLKSDPHTYEKPGTYQVLVKVIDIFGNDTSTIVELKVK